MPKVFATAKGAAIRLGSTFGVATDEIGIEVPEDVADQLEDEIAGCPRDVEEPDPKDPGKTAKRRRQTREKRTDLRVERTTPERKAEKGREK